MSVALENQIKQANQRQQRMLQRLNQQNPQPRIHRAQSRVQQLEYRLAENIRARLSEQRERFGIAVTHLEAVSPLATLARGYSVTTTSDGAVLKKTKQAGRRPAHHPTERRLGGERDKTVTAAGKSASQRLSSPLPPVYSHLSRGDSVIIAAEACGFAGQTSA